ncbi:hypothetical protein D3C75_1245670 [compost metagenome]
MLMMPGVFVSKGVADASEILRFPKDLKIKILVPWGGLMTSMVVFVVAHNVLKLLSLSS